MIKKLTPAKINYLWGGTRLADQFGKGEKGEQIAEAWELSCHPDGLSRLEDGETLCAYLEAHPEAGGSALKKYEHFPVLVKLIDAEADLSVQVHPTDDYARRHENENGKEEMWYIIACKKGAKIYLGLKETLSKEDFARAIEDNTIMEKLRAIEVKPGEHYFIPAGTIHAIGAGCLLAEVQQSSNITYRIYDFDRRDAQGNKRELHIDKAKDVSNLKAESTARNDGPHLAACASFVADLLDLSAHKGELRIEASAASFLHLLLLEDEIILENQGQIIQGKPGESFFVPASSGGVICRGKGKILMTSLPV